MGSDSWWRRASSSCLVAVKTGLFGGWPCGVTVRLRTRQEVEKKMEKKTATATRDPRLKRLRCTFLQCSRGINYDCRFYVYEA